MQRLFYSHHSGTESNNQKKVFFLNTFNNQYDPHAKIIFISILELQKLKSAMSLNSVLMYYTITQ